MPELPVSKPGMAAGPGVAAEPAVAAGPGTVEPGVAAEAPGPRPGWLVPLARSPIAPAEPVIVVAGWQVSAVRAARADLTLTDCTPLAKVGLAARRAEVCSVRFGRAARDPAGTLVVGSGPGEWLLIGPVGQAPALAAGLDRLLAPDDGATWVDLTHGRALVRLTDDRAPGVLAKLSAIDLADDLVPDGAALRTAVAAVATDLVRDDIGGIRSYLLHCERSVGQYLFDAIVRAGAEFGLGVDGFRLPGPPAAD